ncbi:glycosyltransferase 87 family protein [Arthrobacter koreensis]|uniref:glycosyltransferase 87 family protein n=1 Tax=Arthrobacter koreensis TaxID=199136 RepID=UPI0036DB7279
MAQGLRSRAAAAALVLGAAALCAGLLALAMVLAPRDGIDFRVYVAGGQTVLKASGELYSVGIPNPPNPSLMFTYPPAAALLFAVLAPFGDSIGFNIFLGFSLALTALTALCLVAHFSGTGLRAVLKGFWLRPAAIVAFGLVTALGPWRDTLALGQVNIILFAMVMVDFLNRSEQWPRGLLTGVAAGLKLTPLAFAFYYLVRGDWRGLRNMAFGFLATFGLGFLILPRESKTYWGELLPDTSRVGGGAYVDNLSFRGALLHFAGPDADVTVPWLLLCLAAAAAAAVIIRLAARAGADLLALSAAALLMLLVSPVSWSHHWVWVALFLPLVAAGTWRLPRRRRAMRATGWILFMATAAAFYLTPKGIGGLLGAGDLDSQTPELWLMASSAGVFCGAAMLAWFVLLLWPDRPRRWWRAAPVSGDIQVPRP